MHNLDTKCKGYKVLSKTKMSTNTRKSMRFLNQSLMLTTNIDAHDTIMIRLVISISISI